jgi:peptidoglycan/LPS O-acetylase OafA/YrhL
MAIPGHDTPSAPAAFRLGHRPWLDGLRGVAILLVLGGHLHLLGGGFVGVDVFFVLSGFLITSLLVEEWQRRGSISFPRFYLRRALRLLPALLTLLLACYLLTVLFRPADEAVFRKEMVVAACYVANWPTLHQTGLPTLGHTWSLSLEEQFYLLWPWLLYGLLRSGLGRRETVLLVCLGIAASAAVRGVLYAGHAATESEKLTLVMRLYYGLDTRADALLVGCLVALLAAWGMLPRSARSRAATGAGSLLCLALLAQTAWVSHFFHAQYYYGRFTLTALLVGVLLVRLLSGRLRLVTPVLESGALVSVGRISYALYLFHMPVIHWLRPAGLGWDYPAETLLAAGLSFGAAVLSYYAVERPFLRLKHRLRGPDRAEPRAAAAGSGRRNAAA